MPTQGRLAYLDLAKGINILLIVWIHTMEPRSRSAYLGSFIIALFFFVSGYLHRDKPAREYFPKKIQRLYVPYVIFSALSWLFYLAIMIVRQRWEAVPRQLGRIVSVLNGNANNGGNDSIWFLTCLLITSGLCWAIHRLGKNYLIWIAVAASSITGYWLGLRGIILPFKADVALTGLVFYQLGHFARERNLLAFTNQLSRPLFWAAVAAGEAAHLAATYFNLRLTGIVRVAMIGNTLGNYFLFYLASLAGTAVMMVICYKIGHLKFLNYLGANSFLVLALHKPILYLLRLATAGLVDYRSWCYGLVASIVTVALIWPSIGFINKRLPWLLGLKPLFPHR